MLIGYVRVSTEEQNAERQTVLMDDLGVEKIFIDKASGKSADRPQLQELLRFARKGDTVVVESISRFARNTKDLLYLIDILTSKGVEFVSKKESLDTTTPTGKFMLTVFAAVAELEREYTLQRQKEGIALAKARGTYQGRKKIEPENFDEVYCRWKEGDITATQARKLLKMSKSTFYRRVSEKRMEIN